MPITYQEALDATATHDAAGSEIPQDQRERSALAIVAGVAANDAYWNSRSELEALRARAEGHGVVARGPQDEGSSPTVVATGTVPGGVIESTATEESGTALESGSAGIAGVEPASAGPAQVPGQAPGTPPGAAPAPPTGAPAPPAGAPAVPADAQTVEQLRAQLHDAGIEPKA